MLTGDVEPRALAASIARNSFSKNLSEELAPIRDRAFSLMKNTDYVIDVLQKAANDCRAG